MQSRGQGRELPEGHSLGRVHGLPRGSSPFEAANLAEVAIHANARNYYIAASAIADFGEPEAGDSISDGAEVYRVTEMDGLPPWTWADPEHLVFRVHTKRHE